MEQTWVRISIPTSTPPITHSLLRDLEQPTMFPSGVSGKESDWQCRRRKRHGFDPWVGKIPGGGLATHSSVLAWRMDRGVWQAMVHRVTKSQTQLKWLQFSSIQSLSCVRLFETPWTAAARQASLSITNSRSLPRLMSVESVMPSNHLILCRPLLLLPSIFPTSGSFQMSQLFTSGGQNTGVSALTSVLPMNTLRTHLMNLSSVLTGSEQSS